jgi:hyperosmotically inducible periplasmic protein
MMQMQARKPNGWSLSLLAALLLGISGPGAIAATRAQEGQQGSLETQDFAKYDTNGDGYISPEEFAAQHKSAQAFKEADANHDGRLSKDEYVKALAINQRVEASAYVSDAWITTKVKASLMKDNLLAGLRIDVDTQDGNVQLSGRVRNAKQASRAVQIASNIDGVKTVHNDLSLKQ